MSPALLFVEQVAASRAARSETVPEQHIALGTVTYRTSWALRRWSGGTRPLGASAALFTCPGLQVHCGRAETLSIFDDELNTEASCLGRQANEKIALLNAETKSVSADGSLLLTRPSRAPGSCKFHVMKPRHRRSRPPRWGRARPSRAAARLAPRHRCTAIGSPGSSRSPWRDAQRATCSNPLLAGDNATFLETTSQTIPLLSLACQPIGF